MKKKLLIGTIAILAVHGLFNGDFMNAVLGFALAGTIPGTNIAIPFWLMMALYCSLASAVVVVYVELSILPKRDAKVTKKPKARLSRV